MKKHGNLIARCLIRLTRSFEGVPTDSDNRYAFMWNKNAKSSTSKKNVTILKYYFADDVENKALYYQIIPMLLGLMNHAR